MTFEREGFEYGSGSQITKVGLDALMISPARTGLDADHDARAAGRVIGFVGIDRLVPAPELNAEEEAESDPSHTAAPDVAVEPPYSSWAE